MAIIVICSVFVELRVRSFNLRILLLDKFFPENSFLRYCCSKNCILTVCVVTKIYISINYIADYICCAL